MVPSNTFVKVLSNTLVIVISIFGLKLNCFLLVLTKSLAKTMPNFFLFSRDRSLASSLVFGFILSLGLVLSFQ